MVETSAFAYVRLGSGCPPPKSGFGSQLSRLLGSAPNSCRRHQPALEHAHWSPVAELRVLWIRVWADLDEDPLGVWASDAMEAVEGHLEVGPLQQLGDGAKVIDGLKDLEVVLHRVDDLHPDGLQCRGTPDGTQFGGACSCDAIWPFSYNSHLISSERS